MSYSLNADVSNRADYIADLSATDENGADFDFSDSEISISVRDASKCQRLTATVGNGISILDPPITIELHFTAEQMGGLCAGSYDIGGVMKKNGITTQLFVGTFAVYDGIAKL